ncbi:MAG: TraR/DksA family transcriptional regulator [Alishewanella aestuarii]
MDPRDAAAHFKPLLTLELSQLEQASGDTAEARRPVELDQQSVGRLSRMDAMQHQAMASAADVRRHGRIRAIRAALARIESGEFGICEVCGDPIPLRRIQLDPTFTRCVGCRG